MPVQLPVVLSHTYGHGVPFCQVPVMLHVCGVKFEHCLVVGTHTPVQAVPMQTKGHDIVSWKVPVPSHVCSVLPRHVVAPGVQVPVQLPVAQTNMHTWSPPQLPVESQVWAWPVAGSHRLVFGTHDPLHTPAPVQTNGQAVPLLIQLPDELQL